MRCGNLKYFYQKDGLIPTKHETFNRQWRKRDPRFNAHYQRNQIGRVRFDFHKIEEYLIGLALAKDKTILYNYNNAAK